MTGFLGLLIAIFTSTWRGALILAVVCGAPLAALLFYLKSEETGVYGQPLDIGSMSVGVGVGTAVFTLETLAFFGIKVGVRTLWARRSGRPRRPTEERPPLQFDKSDQV